MQAVLQLAVFAGLDYSAELPFSNVYGFNAENLLHVLVVCDLLFQFPEEPFKKLKKVRSTAEIGNRLHLSLFDVPYPNRIGGQGNCRFKSLGHRG